MATRFQKKNSNNKKALDTDALQRELDALHEAGGGTLILPAGDYRTGTIFLRSNVHIHLEQGAHWQASDNIDDFVELDWGHNKDRQPWHLIYARNVSNVAITGHGVIDGGSDAYWEGEAFNGQQKNRTKDRFWIKAKARKLSPLIDIHESEDLRFEGIKIIAGGGWNLHFFNCTQVQIRALRIVNDVLSPNSDGIDLTGCRDVTISDCYIKTCDDAVVLKTLPDSRSCERVTVTNCAIETLCVGIKMGATESYKDMRDLVVSNCVFHACSRLIGLYSLNGAILKNIVVTNISGNTNSGLVLNRPIQLMVGRPKRDVIGAIENVNISNFMCNTDGRILMSSPEPDRIKNITLRDVTLSYPWVEDPRDIGGEIESNQLPRAEGDQCVTSAPAALVFCNVSNLALYNTRVEWPSMDVPEEWRWSSLLENGSDRLHRYTYSESLPEQFFFLFARDLNGFIFDRSSAVPAHSELGLFDSESKNTIAQAG